MHVHPSIDVDDEWKKIYFSDPDFIPDKALLFAILERALMDLFIDENDTLNQAHKRRAVTWILSSEYDLENGFSFLQIADYLEFRDTTIVKIVKLASAVDQKKGKYYELYTRYRSGNFRCIRRVGKKERKDKSVQAVH